MSIVSRRLGRPPIGYNVRLESEKRRFDIAVVFLAIIVAVRLSLQPTSYWNFPCDSPCTHVTMYVVPMLDRWIFLWFGYAISMAIYFSEDYFAKYENGDGIREFARRVGSVLLFFYPVLAAWLVLSAEGSFLTPSWGQGAFWALSSLGLGLILLRSAETLAGFKTLGRTGILSRGIEAFLEVGRVGITIECVRLLYLWRRLRAKITRQPVELSIHPKLRPVLAVLVGIISLISITVAWALGLTGLSLFYAFGTALWAFLFVSAYVGLRHRRDALLPESSLP